MKTYMPLNGLRWSRNSGSANCDMPQSVVFGRPGGGYVANYVIVGKNSVLTKDISQPGVIVAGIPAKVIRKMTPEELERRMNKH